MVRYACKRSLISRHVIAHVMAVMYRMERQTREPLADDSGVA